MVILAILASAVIPMAELSATRSKELELRRALREIRTAIDAYKDDFDRAVEEKKIIPAVGLALVNDIDNSLKTTWMKQISRQLI